MINSQLSSRSLDGMGEYPSADREFFEEAYELKVLFETTDGAPFFLTVLSFSSAPPSTEFISSSASSIYKITGPFLS